MFIDTRQAADILGVSIARVRLLLKQNRIEGAFKVGKFWVIPLFDHRPLVRNGKRGPSPRWCNPRKPALTKVHINGSKIRNNQDKIRKNEVQEGLNPVIKVKKSENKVYCDEIEINGPCRIVYNPYKRNEGGARVWVETLSKVELFLKDFTALNEGVRQSLGFV